MMKFKANNLLNNSKVILNFLDLGRLPRLNFEYLNLLFAHKTIPSFLNSWQITSRILLYTVHPHLKVQMVSGAAPGGTHLGNGFPGFHGLPLTDKDLGAVTV